MSRHPLTRLRRLPWAVVRAVRMRLPRRLRRALLVLAGLQLVGTVGYPLIEGRDGPTAWTWFDGAYMTAITLTTIGYGEVPHPLSVPGRAFTMCLAYTGIFTFAYFASEVVRTVVTGELRELLGRERMEEELSTLAGHVVVCGYGRMGKIVCTELEHQGRRFVVIDKNPVPPADWPFRNGLLLHGDAAEDELLRKARVERAEALIAAVGADADNLYITLSARLLNPKLRIVARAEEEEAEAKLRKVGANQVVSPYLAGAHLAVQAALRPEREP